MASCIFTTTSARPIALEQINSKGYIIPYQPDHRKVVKVGVNFDSATRSIGDWKIVEEV